MMASTHALLTYTSRPEPTPPPLAHFGNNKKEKRARNIKNKIKPKQNFLSFFFVFSRPRHTKGNQKFKPPPNEDQSKEIERSKQGRKEEKGRRKPSKQVHLQTHLQTQV